MKVIAILMSLMVAEAAYSQGNDVRSVRQAPAAASGDIALAARAGLAKVERVGDMVFSYGVQADYGVLENFLVGLGFDYWSRSSGPITENVVEVSDMTISANGKYVFNVQDFAINPYGFAGLAVHRFSVKEGRVSEGGIDLTDTESEDRSTELGFDFGAGVMYQIQQQLDVVGEARYRNIIASGVAFDHLTVTAGVQYRL